MFLFYYTSQMKFLPPQRNTFAEEIIMLLPKQRTFILMLCVPLFQRLWIWNMFYSLFIMLCVFSFSMTLITNSAKKCKAIKKLNTSQTKELAKIITRWLNKFRSSLKEIGILFCCSFSFCMRLVYSICCCVRWSQDASHRFERYKKAHAQSDQDEDRAVSFCYLFEHV